MRGIGLIILAVLILYLGINGTYKNVWELLTGWLGGNSTVIPNSQQYTETPTPYAGKVPSNNAGNGYSGINKTPYGVEQKPVPSQQGKVPSIQTLPGTKWG